MAASGLALRKRYLEQWGLPLLEAEHPVLVGILAAGHIGGSDSIEADDETSRDHDWGPGFTIWLPDDGFADAKEALSTSLYTSIPDEFEGYKIVEGFGRKERSIRIRSMDEFFAEATGGHTTMPSDVTSWNPSLRDESHLYFMKHGAIFHDPSGEFTRRRDAFCTWPRAALLSRIGNALWQLWHFGEYNYARVADRGDHHAILQCKANFVQHAMRACFYLEQDFTPYWKWTAFCFRRIDDIDEVASLLDRFALETDDESLRELIEQLCHILCLRVIDKGFVEADGLDEVTPMSLYNHLEEQSRQLLDGS